MPLKPGSSKHTIASNIREFHHGPKYKQTERTHGKADADRQAIAVAFANAHKHKKKNIIRDPVDYENQRYS